MSTAEIGNKLIAHCNEGRWLDAINELYADGIVSVEAVEFEGFPRRQEGIEAIRAKTGWFLDNHEVHSTECHGPYQHGEDRFAVYFELDVTPAVGPDAGRRKRSEEVGIYMVKDGKIAHEEFYYALG